MKRRILLLTVATVMLCLALAVPAMAATRQDYSILLPRFGQDKYSGTKAVSGYKDFGVVHKYSGGKTVKMTVCDTSHNTLGSKVSVVPGGAYASLKDLWWNNSTSTKYVTVRMESPWDCAVQVLAEGYWYYNY
jgi:hypothetical protein